MFTVRRVAGALALLLLVGLVPARADQPFRYLEGKHGKGELKYINGVPVLILEGTPEEIGEQGGALVIKSGPQLAGLFKDFLKDRGLEKAWPLLCTASARMLPQFPPDYLKELDAISKASGYDRDLFIVANTYADMYKLGGCSTLIVEPERSETKAPLFGRNWDFPPIANLHEMSLVIVCRPKGKHAFASVGFPGMLGCVSAINDAGLALAVNEITEANDDSPRFDPSGTPMVLAFRRVIEECATVEEAEKLLRSMKRTTASSLTVCDKKGGAVFEITPKNLVVRRAEEGICACTNHFRTKELATRTECRRYPILESARAMQKLGVAEVGKKLDEVNQGAYTLQTMVFEPAALKLHLALGKGPASALPLKELDLAPLFGKD
jgi:hypothetical protein